MRPLAALLLFAAAASAQVFSIGTSRSAVVVNETISLTPLLRDPTGNLIQTTDWVWTAVNPGILAVDSKGNATGLRIGFGAIKLESPSKAGTLFGYLQLEVQPASITLTPSTKTLTAGDTFQFTAAALDADGKTIPDAPFTWDITLSDGRPNLLPSGTTIDSKGSFRSTAAGAFTVHALISYANVNIGQPSHFEAVSQVYVVVPQLFQTDRLISSDNITTNSLLPAPGVLVGSESGALAFTASAGGLATAVISIQGASPQALVTAGQPSPQPGGVIAGFQSVAMNAKGESLVAIKAGDRANGALLATSSQGSQFVLLDNATGIDAAGNPAQTLTFLNLTPYCLNDNGTAVVKALYLPQDQTIPRDGLFLLRGALTPQLTPLLIFSSETSLPSVAATGNPARVQLIFDNTEPVSGWASLKGLGIDNTETVYFMARSDSGRGLFQVIAGSTPRKIVAVGDTYLTSKVKDIQDLIVGADGDVAVRVDTTDGNPHLSLYRLGKLVANLVVPGNPNPRVLAISAAGLLFEGSSGAGKPEALYLWNYKSTTPTSVLGLSATLTYISTATMNSKGTVVAAVRSPTNDFILNQLGKGTVIQSGAAANLTAAADLKSFVKGSRASLPSVVMSDPASLFDLDGAGNALPRVSLGQALTGSILFDGSNNFVEDNTGAKYFVTANTLYRYASGAATQLLANGFKAPDGAVLKPRLALGVNNQGIVLLDCSTNAADAHRRLYKLENGTLTQVTRTKSAFAGRQIADWNEGAIDDAGNVVMILVLDDGSQELVHWAGTTATSISNTRSQFLGETVARFDRLRAAGGNFYARFALTSDFLHATVVRFTANSSQSLVRTGDGLPDGTSAGDLRLTDANSNGEVVFTTTVNSTGTQLLGYRGTDGALRIVAANNQALTTGDHIVRFSDAHIRDDGSIYYLAFDVNDRAIVFRAKPGSPTAPAINNGGILNSGDYSADTLTPGSWVAIFGVNFGQAATWTGDPNTFTLGGASVTVCGTPATLSFNSGPLTVNGQPLWQLNALMPDSIAQQSSCPVAVTVNGQPAATVTVAINPGALVLFPWTGSSSGTLPIVTHLDYSLVGAKADGVQPAQPGENLIAWGTGNCSNPKPILTVGGKSAEVQFSGRVASGLCQLNFQVPAGLTGSNSIKFSTSPHQYPLWVQ